MKKIKVVQFDKNYGAWIHVNPDNLEELKNRSDCLVDPDLREVQKIPPCFWKRKGHAAVPMDDAEMAEVRENYATFTPHSKAEIKKLRGFFLSKNVFHRILQKERNDFQFLIIRESEIARKAFLELSYKVQSNTRNMEATVKDTIANFLDIALNNYQEQHKSLWNKMHYRFNIILYLFIGLVLMNIGSLFIHR